MPQPIWAGLLGILGKVVDVPTKNDRLRHLRSIEILSDLPARRLRELSYRLDVVTVAAGTVLIRQGGLNRHAYFVEAGALGIDVDGQRVATVTAGSVVGERSAIDHGPANATVTALEPTTVHVADHRVLLGVAAAEPGFAAVLAGLAADRTNHAEDDRAA